MKKLLHKGHKDKGDKDEKKKEKKEKKEKKDKSKKSKKDKHSASVSSLEEPEESPEQTRQSTTVVTKTTITSDSPGGEKKTTVVKETVREGDGERSSEKKVEETRSGKLDEEHVVQKTTTTSITQSEPDKPAEIKTVVKETTNKTPQGEERVVVTKTTSEVQSAPSTREFLMDNFPEAARLETTRHIQQSVVSHDMRPGQPSHVSERTVIRQVNDGGKTVETVTKIVSDDGGTRQTTTTTSSGGQDEADDDKDIPDDEDKKDTPDDDDKKDIPDDDDKNIVSKDVERKADLPEWLNDVVATSTPKGEVKIDDSIKIPSPPLKRKQEDKPKPGGPKVVEEVFPIEDKKENIMDFLDDLENVGKEQPKEEKKPEPPAEIPFTYEPKKPEKNVYVGDPVNENVDSTMSVRKTEAGIDFDSLEKTPEPAKPKRTERTVQQTHKRTVISNNGDTVETVTKTTTDDDGRVKTTETKTISGKDQKPMQVFDVNENIIDSDKPKTSPKMSSKNLREDIAKRNEKNVVVEEDDDDDDDDREVMEEIIVIEKKRRVRIPKSFVPYERERPKAVLPFDMLFERKRSPRKAPPVGYRVDEKVEEASPQSRKNELPDLDELDRLMSGLEAAEQK